jgi:hypothetical protein
VSTHSVWLIPKVQCTECLSHMQIHREGNELHAWCSPCDITVKLPIAPLTCEIVPSRVETTG